MELPTLDDVYPLLPGGLAGATLLIVAGVAQRRPAPSEPDRIGSLMCAGVSFAVALGVTWSMFHASLPWPPASGTERMLYAVAVVGVLAVLVSERSRAIRWSVFGAFALGTVGTLLYPLIQRGAEDPHHLPMVTAILLAVGLGVLITALDGLGRNLEGAALPIAISLSLGCVGQTVVLFGQAKLAQLAGTTAIALGTYGVLAGAMQLRALPRPAGVVASVVAAVLCLDAFYYGDDVPALPLLLMVAAPTLTIVGKHEKVASLHPKLRFSVLLLLVLVPLTVAMALVLANAPEPDPYSSFGK